MNKTKQWFQMIGNMYLQNLKSLTFPPTVQSISHVMQAALDDATDPWGVKVERVEMWVMESTSVSSLWYFSFFSKDVRLPVQLQRAMAAEAEAAREARAKVTENP